MNDKLFKITVIALLVLVLGAVVGTLSSVYIHGPEEFLEFEGEFIDVNADHFQFNKYTFSEFSILVETEIENKAQFIAFAEENEYEIEEYDEIVEAYKELECEEDNVGRPVCAEEIIVFDSEHEIVEYSIIGYSDPWDFDD